MSFAIASFGLNSPFAEKISLCYARKFNEGKIMRYLSTFIIGILAIGCTHTGDFMARYHENGVAKPIASVAAVIDTSSYDASWSLSEELTSMVVSQVRSGGKIFLLPKDDDSFVENPFGQDLSWVKSEFPDREFVVFLELVEHEISPVSKEKKDLPVQEVSSNLNVAMRLRVVDIRSATPKVVLQELVRDNYFIPKTLIPVDYNTTTWGSPEFAKTPMGIAHAQLVQEIGARISDYILLAKSR